MSWSAPAWPGTTARRLSPRVTASSRHSPRRGPVWPRSSRCSGRSFRTRGRPARRSASGWASTPARHRRRRPAWSAWTLTAPPGSRQPPTGGRSCYQALRPRCFGTRCRRASRSRTWACTGSRTSAGPSRSSSSRPTASPRPSRPCARSTIRSCPTTSRRRCRASSAATLSSPRCAAWSPARVWSRSPARAVRARPASRSRSPPCCWTAQVTGCGSPISPRCRTRIWSRPRWLTCWAYGRTRAAP